MLVGLVHGGPDEKVDFLVDGAEARAVVDTPAKTDPVGQIREELLHVAASLALGIRNFYDGMADRPETTFGTMNDDVLAHFDPDFHREDFVRIIQEQPS